MEIGIVVVIGILAFYFLKYQSKKKWIAPTKVFPKKWRTILVHKVNFYSSLTKEEKKLFEYKTQEFLLNHKISGVNCNIDITDKLLVAASAVIPIFKFPDWRYDNLFEVLLYPAKFNTDFETSGENRNILGMVGTGYMEGKMILSKPALHLGFNNDSDKKNTAIHEFIHLIDKADGTIDGIPRLLLEQPYIVPWLDLMNCKMDEIYEQESDINPYGGTNRVEFFAVASEYFFERPKLLAKKHPELYEHLEEIFDQDMDARNLDRKRVEIGRNDPCPCGSGIKYKRCCAE